MKGDKDLMGKMVHVEIYETGKHFMKSRLVENSEIVTPGLNAPLQKGEVSGFDDERPKVCCLLPFSYFHCGFFYLSVPLYNHMNLLKSFFRKMIFLH